MIPECQGIAGHYASRGLRTLVGDLLELEISNDQVLLRGEPVHLVFRKFSTASFRLRMEDRNRFGGSVCRKIRNIWKAVGDGRVCLVNPLGSTTMQDKGLLEYVRASCPEVQPVIPETYILGPDLPVQHPFLWDEIRRGEPFILKRRKSFGGKHVILSPETVRERAPQLLGEEPNQWVAQKRVHISRFPFAVWESSETRVGPFPFTISPFGASCFVRLSAKGNDYPLSAHSGGAASFALVVKG